MRWQHLIPVASIVSSFLAFSVVWWAWQRRKEREAYYRYELSRLMLERSGDSPERLLAWTREQEEADARRRRELQRLLTWVLLLGGVGALVGVRFTTSQESLFGWVPIGVGVGLALNLALSRPR